MVISLSGCKKEVIAVSKTTIVGWGDDLTYGVGGRDTTYLTELAKLTGLQTYNMGAFSETSTQIKERMISDESLHVYPTIIWAGRYNTWHQETIKNDIAEMVASLGHSNYLILGLINADNGLESKGRDNYNRIISINKALAGIYSDHFLDIRTYLVAQYNPQDAFDVKDHTLDIVPRSLRNGLLNLNAKGYRMVAGQVNTKINILRGDATATTK
ncbi:hypothetical protein FFF34_008155 [Inquilinus sp. KBS0705]|nr:hypothetical protein FFF34_008155 [Inquilinus sp. KBS0705]